MDGDEYHRHEHGINTARNGPSSPIEKQELPVEHTLLAKIDACDATKFSTAKKVLVIIAGFTCTFNGTFGSSMPSGAMDAIEAHFQVTNSVYLTLLNSLYMAGFVLGPLLFGPLSEYIGRRPVMIGTFVGYLVFMLASSWAPNYPALLVFRLLCGMNAAAATAVIGGLYADIFDDPSARGNAMALYMTVTTFGPVLGPTVSGFASTISWRWPFWVASMIGGAGLPFVLSMPETYGPVLHNKIVRQHQVQFEDCTMRHPAQVKKLDVGEIFFRPLKMLFTEPILFWSSAYLALAYSIFYLLLQVYPIIFQGLYGLSPGFAGLAYTPMLVGTMISVAVFVGFTWYHDRQMMAEAPWTKREVYRRLPLACIASPCLVTSLFWLAWTPWPRMSPIVPSVSGLFFALGYQLLFMGMVNYVTDVYKQRSASAIAAASMFRSIGATLLPLAADSMYDTLGIHWGSSILGFVSFFMGIIPFIFIKYGDYLAKTSKFT